MHIVCPHCTTSYAINLATLGVAGRTVRCSRCKEVWLARPEDAIEASAPVPAMAVANEAAGQADAAAEWEAMAREEGRDPSRLGSALYHNININADRRAALEESKGFLDTYYTAKFSARFVEQWTVAGSPRECVEQLRAYFDAGLGHMALRLASWDQRGQFKRFLEEVAPAFATRS